MRRVSPLLFRQHSSSRLSQACTHEDGRSIRDHRASSLRNHLISMARYRFYTRAKTLALRPLGIRVLMVGGLSSAFVRRPATALPLSPSPYTLSGCEYIIFVRDEKNTGWGFLAYYRRIIGIISPNNPFSTPAFDFTAPSRCS